MGVSHGKHKANSLDRAILKVKTQRDTVKIYMKKLEQSLDFETDLAIQLLQKNNREKARCILRKRVALARYLKNTDDQLENLERMIYQMENAQIQSKVVDGLKTGSRALQRALNVLNIKHIENILDSSERGFEKLEEINHLLTGLKINDDEIVELEEELEKLKEQSSAVIVKTPTALDSVSCGSSRWGLTLRKRKKGDKLSTLDSASDVSKPSTSKTVGKIRGQARVLPLRAADVHGKVRPKEIGIVISD